eukprot:TRINITY_DN137_c0_g1_i1.p1 TRINITY_DN137_c0_g1~~TRINITY_DN137_c0_g1_i1.p1  ORF type:complete len:176 (+),score=25.16 TRINITY_DN137_c0_g1_i1:81-608(+)
MRHYHEYQVMGRKLPSVTDPKPKVFRMRIFAKNEVVAKSRFWYFLSQIHKLKKTSGEIISVNEIFEKKPNVVKNFGIFLRYNSRSGTHNMYKEFRDITRVGAIAQLYDDMAARHSARDKSIQIIQIEEVPNSKCRRPYVKQFHSPTLRFPLPHRANRITKATPTFARRRPSTYAC